MRSKSQLMKDYKLKKMKCDIGEREKEADVLFNLLIKYILPLEPEQFRFQIDGELIKVDTHINKNKILLNLNFGKITNPEDEANFSINDNIGGKDRAKKIINQIRKITDG